jgi:hypothetical protein
VQRYAACGRAAPAVGRQPFASVTAVSPAVEIVTLLSQGRVITATPLLRQKNRSTIVLQRAEEMSSPIQFGVGVCRTAGGILLLAIALPIGPVWAADDDPRPAAGIQDNSFLVEEAYNQEAGVVQHINGLLRTRNGWFYAFVQEWPMGSQDHQFSYAVPYAWTRNDAGQRVDGVGDIFINYRPQIWRESTTMPAYTQRFSLVVPTGSRSKGLGEGSLGFQTNAAFSKIVTDRLTLNANAGFTTFFDVDGRHPTSSSVRGSAIYAFTRDFNVLLESVAEWNQTVNDAREIEREFVFTVSPGFRYALNYPQLNDLQVVFGAATPISFKHDKPTEFGLFLYLSFEHRFLPQLTQLNGTERRVPGK